MSERWLQVSAGQGPVECAWAALKVVEKICGEARVVAIEAKALEIIEGEESGTAQSALISIAGGEDALETFIARWLGTVQWIARSPFRPNHTRKNWFVGVEVLAPLEATEFDSRDVKWETMRASGPGGQHVNRTESAVRLTHLPTGIQVVAAEERSQHRNRKLALARLAAKLADADAEREGQSRNDRWRAHQQLERGNPVRVFKES
jgi:peptide chain release factor